MALKIDDLDKIWYEFPDVYDEIFENAAKRTNLALKAKKDTVAKINQYKRDKFNRVKRGNEVKIKQKDTFSRKMTRKAETDFGE